MKIAALIMIILLLSPVLEDQPVHAEDSVGKLIRNLQDKHTKTRANAAKELGDLKDARAVDPLIKSLKDDDSYVRGQAASSLGKLKDARAVDPLIYLFKDDYTYVRAEAARALGEIGNVRAAAPLINFLKDDSTYAREEAVKSLIRMGPDAIRPLLNALKEKNLRIVADAYCFFICRGEQDAEELLIEALNAYGNKKMSDDFALSGNVGLKEAAYKWAGEHKYKIGGLLGASNSLVWGRCKG